MIKRADIILAVILILLGGLVSYVAAQGDSRGDMVLITVDGKEYGRYSLSENRDIVVKQNGHMNKILIREGMVSMGAADCSNQICVNTGTIEKTSQSIICLPNKVVVQIIGKEEAGYDAVSN
ncbi:NusG domain II-containing protein [Aminipila luticellarii]|uniref:NusG domain II-containing protein n=1 Tax=Aminipila luticellarii TaxID=2507160 RepID=A0A410PY97_9FIRM|nr:NusG domain II-containing protein [Aminipila luticellarii]QAT43937.1 NusG domain II-containing protein [Aminipila luticellarii]